MGKIDINRIVVTGRLCMELREIMKDIPSKEFLFVSEEEVTEDILKWADAFVAFKPVPNFNFHNIKWVHSLGAGVDGFTFKRTWKEDVILTRTVCSFGKKISEYCLSYILAHLQRHELFIKQQELKIWKQEEPISLSSQCIVILGTGVIGQEVARNLGALGAVPIGVSLSGFSKQNFERVIKLEELYDILPQVNWLINTLPLTEKTENIIDGSILFGLRSAGFINVGRGKTISEDSLIEALNSDCLHSAVLDVFPQEPVPKQSTLWEHSKVRITPHISALTSVEEAVQCLLNTMTALENGEEPLNKVILDRGY